MRRPRFFPIDVILLNTHRDHQIGSTRQVSWA
jgi:hypothetical protein